MEPDYCWLKTQNDSIRIYLLTTCRCARLCAADTDRHSAVEPLYVGWPETGEIAQPITAMTGARFPALSMATRRRSGNITQEEGDTRGPTAGWQTWSVTRLSPTDPTHCQVLCGLIFLHILPTRGHFVQCVRPGTWCRYKHTINITQNTQTTTDDTSRTNDCKNNAASTKFRFWFQSVRERVWYFCTCFKLRNFLKCKNCQMWSYINISSKTTDQHWQHGSHRRLTRM